MVRLSAEPLNSGLRLGNDLVDRWTSWGPSMSPDGNRIAYVSDRRGTPELWMHTQDCAQEPIPIPLSADPVLEVSWSADGQWLACAMAANGGVRSQVWVLRPDGTDVRRVAGSDDQHAALGPWTRLGHKLVVELAPTRIDEQTRCVLIDPVTGAHIRLAEGDLITALDLSSDERFLLLRDGTRGAQFCVVVDRSGDCDHPLLPYPAAGSTDVGLLRRSPPGDPLPMTAYLVSDAGLPRRALIAQAVGPDGLRGPAGAFAARDDGELEFLDADENGKLLLLVWNVAGTSEVELLDTRTHRRRTVSMPASVVSGCALSRDGSRLVLCIEGPDRPRDLWTARTSDAALAPVGLGSPAIQPLVHPTLETFESHDGLMLTGWLYRARDDESGPAMISLHGGPESQERPAFSPQHQAMVAAGITVFAPNVRGSSGFGKSFVHADDRHGRHDAIADVRSCAEFLIERGISTSASLAVTGRSYGGYLTLASLARYPNLFAAGVDICGMSDLLSFYRNSEPWIAAAAVSKYGHPVVDHDLLADLSPLARAHRITAPLLVVHGQHDTNVPISEAHQIVDALKALNRSVEYLELENEGHEYRHASSRKTLIRTMVSFLSGHLKR